jgi:uncharacterized protein (DUF1810 family)
MIFKSEAETHDLQRFVEAQFAIYPQVIEELCAGRKRNHWMWFVFPQIIGLGSSVMAQRYAIRSKGEAEAYLAHKILGSRLLECTRLVMAANERSIAAILGSPDDVKFRSSMTLFDAVSQHEIFAEAIGMFYAEDRDSATLDVLQHL